MKLRRKYPNKNLFLWFIRSLFLFIIILSIASCKKSFIPKPRAYFRIDFPEKKYQAYRSNECRYTFEYPVYGTIVNYDASNTEPCWINIEFPEYKGKIHLTYRSLKNDLEEHIEDTRALAYKHIIKADDIIENPLKYPERNVFGIFYDITGNTASSVNFYVTDSVMNFLRGSLYFSVRPNKDSLAPVIDFFKVDIRHLIETFEWN
ncbi:MAG: gliding motility lipoprotein GldD [Bacteroidales bacterium]|nr:MAG: gliding motility lipoprotein GldD [Bacteroidales bacterium]